jgi:hypothetical protein
VGVMLHSGGVCCIEYICVCAQLGKADDCSVHYDFYCGRRLPFVVVCEACAAPPSCDGQAVPVFIAVGPEGGCEVADHAVNRVTAKLVG